MPGYFVITIKFKLHVYLLGILKHQDSNSQNKDTKGHLWTFWITICEVSQA